jgi:FkbM family methyltransferase
MMSNAQPSEKSLLRWLADRPTVHRAIALLRLQALTKAALSVRAVHRRTPKLGLEYRIRYLETFVIADEIFRRHTYDAAFARIDVRTFIDLGSNVGFFALYAAERTGRRDLTGLVVDANPNMADESRWHMERNGLTGSKVRQGLVGYPKETKEATFYLNASNVASSAQPNENPNVPAKGKTRKVVVPTLDLLAAWKEHAGDRRIDLLKVDVEGFEAQVLKTIGEVLDLTDGVVIEWHRWVASREEVAAILKARGFELTELIGEDIHAGIGVFRRVKGDAAVS